MNRDKLKRIARAVVPLGSPALRVSGKRTSLSLLRYKPERRAVVAADLGLVDETTGRESRLAALLKAYADDTGRETALFSFGLAAAQPHDDAPRLARILGYDPDTGILFQERLTGHPLLEADEGTEMARRAGRCLAWLHGIPIRRRANQDRTGSWALSRCVSELQPMGDHLARIGVSDKAARARNLLTTLERRSPSSSLSAMVHGDFNHNQVLVNGGEVAFIDFDEAGAGDPRIDVGNFMAHLRYLSTGPPWIDRSLATMESAFLEGYREAGGREFESLSWFVALGLARLAAAPFRTLAQDWERETSMILDAALAQT